MSEDPYRTSPRRPRVWRSVEHNMCIVLDDVAGVIGLNDRKLTIYMRNRGNIELIWDNENGKKTRDEVFRSLSTALLESSE